MRALLIAGLAVAACASPVTAVPMERPNPDGQMNPASPVSVKVTSPEMDEIVDGPKVEVHFELENFEMTPNGPHLHFVLDNGPLQEHFKPDAPIVLPAVPAGTHLLAVFPVTSWHEGWKEAKSLALVRFHVGSADPAMLEDLSKPLLIFNMPQGVVKKWKDHWVLFDFLVLNAGIAEGDTRMQDARIRYLLDGTKNTAEYQESRFWLKLEAGAHRIDVWVTDKRGDPLPNGRWNRASRSFYVE